MMPPYPAGRLTGDLTPRAGYRVTISQTFGGRPAFSSDCLRCTWHEPVGFPQEDLADPDSVGATVLEAIRLWLTHAQADHPEELRLGVQA